jgi:hypothetical protein
MGVPTVVSRAAFSTAPFATTPTWTDTSAYLLEFSTTMGRSSERDNIQAGTHSVIYDNRDRRFDPTNTSSTYSPNILPMKKSQLRATWSGTTYDLATGYADSWEQVVVNTGQVQSQLSAVDAMGVLNTSVFSTPATVDPPNHDLRVSERSDQRIAWVLDQIGFPAADRSFDTGQVAIQAFAFDNYNALQHIGDVVEAEVGLFFINGSGSAVFHDKLHRLRAPYNAVQATFGDGVGELPYSDIKTTYNRSTILNEVTMRKANDTEAVAYVSSDSASQTAYGKRSLEGDSWAASSADVENTSAMFILFYKDPQLRITEMTLSPQMNDSIWPHALGRQIGDQIIVKSRYYGKGAVFSQNSRIESIAHHYTQTGSWTTTWGLSPVPAAELLGYWILNTSALDSSTRLAY